MMTCSRKRCLLLLALAGCCCGVARGFTHVSGVAAGARVRWGARLPSRSSVAGSSITARTSMSWDGPPQSSPETAYQVIFVRHGQSTWNKANRFIGWTDPNLTKTGELEARVAGQVLLAEGFDFDVIYTSLLKRSIKTAWVVMDELGLHHVPVVTDWRLNERCYGALVGRNKKECVRVYGQDQVKLWRRSFDVRPPPISEDSPLWPGNSSKYDFLARELVPRTESLADTQKRSVDCWENTIVPAIRSGRKVCVCGHENNLRSLLMYLDGVTPEDIRHVELPRAVPLIYHFDKNLKPIKLEGAAPYLSGCYIGDPEEINIIMERDQTNVYDLSVEQNLEESAEPHFAAKLDDLIQPCEVIDYDDDGIDDASAPAPLPGGLGCRDTEIDDTPLLLYHQCHDGTAQQQQQQRA